MQTNRSVSKSAKSKPMTMKTPAAGSKKTLSAAKKKPAAAPAYAPPAKKAQKPKVNLKSVSAAASAAARIAATRVDDNPAGIPRGVLKNFRDQSIPYNRQDFETKSGTGHRTAERKAVQITVPYALHEQMCLVKARTGVTINDQIVAALKSIGYRTSDKAD